MIVCAGDVSADRMTFHCHVLHLRAPVLPRPIVASGGHYIQIETEVRADEGIAESWGPA